MIVDLMAMRVPKPIWFGPIHTPDNWKIASKRRDDFIHCQPTNEQKEEIIARACSTKEGRITLAQAMVEPRRTQLEYASVGRRLFMADELPEGAMATKAEIADIQEQIVDAANPDLTIRKERWFEKRNLR